MSQFLYWEKYISSLCKKYDIYTESDHIQELLKPNGMFEKQYCNVKWT